MAERKKAKIENMSYSLTSGRRKSKETLRLEGRKLERRKERYVFHWLLPIEIPSKLEKALENIGNIDNRNGIERVVFIKEKVIELMANKDQALKHITMKCMITEDVVCLPEGKEGEKILKALKERGLKKKDSILAKTIRQNTSGVMVIQT